MRAQRWGVLTVAGLVACLSGAVHAQAALPNLAFGAENPLISGQDMASLAQAQRALIEARALSAQLDEYGALQRLLSAERALREILHVPSVHAWLAEVWLQMGIIAAQRGEASLAGSLLSRALSLDVSRQVGAAEAAPKIVAFVASLARERDAAARSRFRVEPTPAEANVWIDGRARGRGALELDLAPGPHLLRVAAPGHATYAAVIETWAGTRAPVSVMLAAMVHAEAVAVSPIEPLITPPKLAQLNTRTDIAAREKPRWWRLWPAWTSAAVIIAAGAITLALARGNDDTVTERKLRVDPGPTRP